MRAFVVHELTHPSKISLETNFSNPTVGPQEVLVDVYTAGLNFLDVRLSSCLTVNKRPFLIRFC